MTRIVELADGHSSATAPTTTAVPTTGDEVSLDPTGTDYTAVTAQELLEESDLRLSILEDANFDNFLGYWNATTNSPALANGGGGGIVEGQYYVVSTAGSTTLDGISEWGVGDEVFFDGTVWKKRDNSDLVLSVAGRVGDVVLDAADVAETATRFWAKKMNVTTTNPAVGNDNTEGYSIGSRWLNSTTSKLYIATDVSVGAAVWVVIGGDVASVNGQTGAVVLGADDIAPSTTRYWSLKDNMTATVAPTATDDAASNYANGSAWYNKTTKFLYILEDSTTGAAVWGIAAGGGGGGLDGFVSETFVATKAVDFAKGNAAAAVFPVTGTFAGTLADETASPLNGTSSMKFTQAAGSLNDYALSPAYPVPIKARGGMCGIKFAYNYDGLAPDIRILVWDATNGTMLTSTVLDVLQVVSSKAETFQAQFFMPLTCANIRYGFQVAALNSGKIFQFDDVEIAINQVVYGNETERQYINYTTTQTAFQDRTGDLRFPAGLTTAMFSGPVLLEVVDDSGSTRTRFVARRKCVVTVTMGTGSGNTILYIQKTTPAGSVYVASGSAPPAGGTVAMVAGIIPLEPGDYFCIQASAPLDNTGDLVALGMSIEASSQVIITPAKSNMSDWTSYTPTTQGFGTVSGMVAQYRRVGQDIEIRANFVSGTSTATESRLSLPSGLTSAGTANIPTIQIAQGYWLRGIVSNTSHGGPVLMEPNVNYVTFASMQVFGNGAVNSMAKEVGNSMINSGESCNLFARIPIAGWTSDAIFLAGIPVPRVAFLKDVKSNGVGGGTFNSGAWQTRELNTIQGDSSFVSLSSNLFTLAPGKYLVEASAPAGQVAEHVIKLLNSTDTIDEIIGQVSYAPTALGLGVSALVGEINLSSAKSYAIQHRCTSTKSGNGFGYAMSFGVSEVYTVVKITKLR